MSGVPLFPLKRGWSIWFRAMAMPDKAAAVRMQDNLLAKNRYDWNVILNGD